jgi:LPS export ABC transporter protein LptC
MSSGTELQQTECRSGPGLLFSIYLKLKKALYYARRHRLLFNRWQLARDNPARMPGRLLLTVTLLALFTAGCSDEIPVLKEEGTESGSTIRISNFHREQYNALGAPEMRVKAREAYIYESGEGANKTQERLVGYDFQYTDIDGADTTILTAQKAEMNQKTGIMYMTGNVHLKGLDREIRGEALYYDMKKKIARSDQPVYIKEGEISTHCRGGVVMYMNEEKQICRLPAGKREKRKPAVPGTGTPQPGQGDDLFQ